MTKCPDNPNKNNCAIEAAQDLVDKELVVVDYSASTTGESGLYVQAEGASALEVFTVRDIEADGMTDIANLGCFTCGRCIQIADDMGDMTVRFAEV